MTVSVWESAKSRPNTHELRGGSATRLYNVLVYPPYTISDDADAYAAVAALAPATLGVWQMRSIAMDPQGGPLWMATVTYGPSEGTQQNPTTGTAPTPPATTDPLSTATAGGEFSFDVTGGTVHITQSLQTVYSSGRAGAGSPPGYDKAIGVGKDGVAGTDVQRGAAEFSITRNFEVMTLAYIQLLAELAWSTNDASWYHFDIGEVLFKGASGSIGTDNVCKVTFKFGVGRVRTNVDVVDPVGGTPVLRIPTLKPHDYLWCTYEDAIVTIGGLQHNISRAKAVYVERVYPEKNFNLLLI